MCVCKGCVCELCVCVRDLCEGSVCEGQHGMRTDRLLSLYLSERRPASMTLLWLGPDEACLRSAVGLLITVTKCVCVCVCV